MDGPARSFDMIQFHRRSPQRNGVTAERTPQEDAESLATAEFPAKGSLLPSISSELLLHPAFLSADSENIGAIARRDDALGEV